MSFTLAKRTLVGSLVTAVSSFSTLAVAQQQAGFTITPSIGYYNMDDDRNTKDDVAYSLGVGYQFDNPWAAELVHLNVDTRLSSSNTNVDVEQYRLDALYHLPVNYSLNLTPYLAAGIGTADINEPSTNNTQLNAGGGVKYALNDGLLLRADFRLLHDEKDHHVDHIASVGLQMTFGHTESKAKPMATMSTKPVTETPLTEETVIEEETTTEDPAEGSIPALKVIAEPNMESQPIEGVLPTQSIPNKPVFIKDEEPRLSEQAMVVETQRPVTLQVQFDSNTTTVEEAFYPEIEKLAIYLNENPYRMVVLEGHTDSRGGADYNQAISEKRAQAIADVLIKTFQVSEKRVSAIGYGEEQPLFSNDTEEHRKANRRVAAVIFSNEVY